MVANFAALGVLMAISAQRAPVGEPHRFASRSVSRRVTGLRRGRPDRRPDRRAVVTPTTWPRPHLGLQADGGRRYEYNPRVLDVARQLRAAPCTIAAACRWRPATPSGPHGAIGLRNEGIRSTRRASMRTSAATHSAAARFICSATARRASTGARRTRRTSSATPTIGCAASTTTRRWCPSTRSGRSSGDAPPRLPRDRAAAPASPPAGSSSRAALRDKPRDVTMTIDARLQYRVSDIVEAYAGRSGRPRSGGRARSRHRRRAGERQLSVARRSTSAAARPGSRTRGCVPRPGALRSLSAGIDVQARDRRRGASPGPDPHGHDVRLLACRMAASARALSGWSGRSR